MSGHNTVAREDCEISCASHAAEGDRDASAAGERVNAHTANAPIAAFTPASYVRDNGCGIPAADVPRVFERGFTGQVGRAHGSATGMGLYLVASLCASMGLHVGLASEEGTGTRVILTFPHDRTRKELFGA